LANEESDFHEKSGRTIFIEFRKTAFENIKYEIFTEFRKETKFFPSKFPVNVSDELEIIQLDPFIKVLNNSS
jgi:hypothetical protein